MISKNKAAFADTRLNMTEKLVSQARNIKMLCWEEMYSESVTNNRNKELLLNFYRGLCQVTFGLFRTITVTVGTFFVIYVMEQMNVPITASVIYPIRNMLCITQDGIFEALFMLIENSTYFFISIKRIQKILNLNEILICDRHLKEAAVVLKDVNCSWDSTYNSLDEGNFCLKSINLNIPFEKVTVITGPIGGGKSTLLLTMANEMYVHSGTVMMGGSFTYLPQEPWIFPATIRQNILFGLPFDQSRYQTTLSSCALLQDLLQLPNGDSSIVDDKGLTLSGGQKARIALARALYRQSDIYLLDDPLSAVDVKVGRHIWQNFQNTKKTIVLVTHQLQLLSKDNIVVYVEKGHVTINLHDELKINLNLVSRNDSVNDLIEDSKMNSVLFEQLLEPKNSEIQLPKLNIYSKKNPILIYANAAIECCNGWGAILIILLLIILKIAANVLYNIYFILFVQFKEEESIFQIPIYQLGCLVIAELFMRITQNAVFVYLCIRASAKIHHQALNSVIRTKMTFFDIHSVGEIINYFAKDMEILDEILPETLYDLIEFGSLLIGFMCVTSYSNPIVIIPMILLLIAAIFIYHFYYKSVKSIQIKEAIARGPVYTHVNSTLNGIAVIRSHENQKRLTNDFNHKQDQHAAAWFLMKEMEKWLIFTMDLTGTLLPISFIIITVVISQKTNASLIGMGISSSFQFGFILYVCIYLLAEYDAKILSVTRLNRYFNLPAEKGYEIVNKDFTKFWPQFGGIIFSGVTLTYESNSKTALKDICFKIIPGEKIGIVGRTGAGKSSLITALFRLAEFKGSIEIDGVDIQKLPLTDYRSKLSIIPQDPVTLSGSIRHNLDPRSEFKDEDLWNVLESVELKEEVCKKELGLEVRMDQLSVGQKQLFCLARTLLQNNKIIILDEATSNVDNNTDQIIQQLIRTKFSSSTILVVAHRLQTVIDLDRIMVLENSFLVEMDQPKNVINNPKSVFNSMVQKIKC